MKIFPGFRLLAFLRRIAIAEERVAAVAEEWIERERERWGREDRSRHPRPTEFGTFDIEEANKRWRAEQEAAEYGGIPEETPPHGIGSSR